MMRMRSPKSVLLTEADSDTDLYRKFINESRCLVRSAGSRAGVLAMLERLSLNRLKGCVGIVDADCDYVLGRLSPSLDVFRTDTTDKETMIIDSPAFDDFCLSLQAKIAPSRLREMLLESSYPLGAIRRSSVLAGLAIDFKNVTIGKFVTDGPICDVDGCCAEVLAVNQHLGLDMRTMRDFVQDRVCSSLPKPKVVRGHDLVSILECQARLLFGRSVSQRELEYELAKAYMFHHFQLTETYADLLKWEDVARPTWGLFA
jgi:hypothetical protein